MRNLDPELKNKLIGYITKEHEIDPIGKRIFLIRKTNLSEVDEITRGWIKMLQRKEKFKVYSQLELF